MSLLKSLFAETANHGVHKKHLKRISKSCHHLADIENRIPDIDYPEYGSKKFYEDIETVEHCYKNKSLNTSFLGLSHSSVEDVFKNFLKEESPAYINWDLIDTLLDEVDSIILRMKYKKKRLRPRNYLIEKCDSYKDIHESKSYSFPSGHTAIAYFLSGVLTEAVPHLRSDLEMLSELIGQSRIENGVHYPTDVSYGRFVGEMLADYFNQKEKTDLKDLDIENIKSKKVAKFFRKKALETRPHSSKEQAYKLYTTDLGRYIHRTCELDDKIVDDSECMNAARNFMSGYPPGYCSRDENIQSILTALSIANQANSFKAVPEFVSVHKALNPNTLSACSPGKLRSVDTNTNYGMSNCSVDNMHVLLKGVLSKVDDPMVKHAVLSWLNPFLEGTGRTSRIVLLSDLDYNLDIVNQILDSGYDLIIAKFLEHQNPEKLMAKLKLV